MRLAFRDIGSPQHWTEVQLGRPRVAGIAWKGKDSGLVLNGYLRAAVGKGYSTYDGPIRTKRSIYRSVPFDDRRVLLLSKLSPSYPSSEKSSHGFNVPHLEFKPASHHCPYQVHLFLSVVTVSGFQIVCRFD
jgi:hypothetical protein